MDICGTDECWEWMGTQINSGHGRLGWNTKHVLAHRVAYELFYGPIPEGAVVRHTCDNPPCCNPLHLIAGTQQQNLHDKYERKRDNQNTVVTRETVGRVRYLLARYGRTLKQKQIAELAGVSEFILWQIRARRTWLDKQNTLKNIERN